VCIYLYTYKINGNIGYMLRAISIVRRASFVFGSEIIHWACGRSNPPLYPFSPGIKVLDPIKLIATLCSFVWSCEVPLYAHVHVSSICNLYLNMYENMYDISSTKELFESLCKAMWANHLLGRRHCKLNRVSFTFLWCMVGCLLRALWAVEFWLRCVAVELLKHKYMLNCNSCMSNL